jgi:hypothetical protein
MIGREDYQAGQKSCNEGTKELNTKNTGGQDVFLIERKGKDEEAAHFFLILLSYSVLDKIPLSALVPLEF